MLTRILSRLTLAFFPAVVVEALFFFDTSLEFPPESFLEDAPWIFAATTDLPVSVDDCWTIMTDDEGLQFWFPELTIVQNLDPPGQRGYRRVVRIDLSGQDDLVISFLSLLSPAGGIEFEETFDVWDPDGNERRSSFFVTKIGLPTFLLATRVREEQRCEFVTDSSSAFTQTLAMEPGWFASLIGFLTKPIYQELVEERIPGLLLEAIANGNLPRQP